VRQDPALQVLAQLALDVLRQGTLVRLARFCEKRLEVLGDNLVEWCSASSDLKLNPHLHAVFLDGVYAAGAGGTLEFRALPRLSTRVVADALQIARARILGY